MLEYEDYKKQKTICNASEFITRALEDHAHEVMASKTYADYIATRPRAERFGSHGLFTDEGVPVKLSKVSEELNRYDGNVWTVIISLRREDAERLGYLSGFGCEESETEAQEWFYKAYCAFLVAEAKGEKKGYLQYRIGKLWSLGYGVEQDDTEAATWYEKAVDEENPFAAYALGCLYHRGKGVPQDDKEAYRLFVMAAMDKSKPNAYAAYELGKMCQEGIGTRVDELASKEWYKKAYQGFCKIEATMADDRLYYRLGQMNAKGIGTDVNLQKAKEYFEKAVLLENKDAMFRLGILYLNSAYEGHDREQGIYYINLAAEHGNEYAARQTSK